MATFEHDSAGFLIGKLIKASDRNEKHIKEQLELLRSQRAEIESAITELEASLSRLGKA